MTKFLLTDWEINGHNDSDFMCSYYDDVTNTIGFHEYGTTRFPSHTNIGINIDGTTSVVVSGDTLRLPNQDVVEKARLVLEDLLVIKYAAADKKRVEEPHPAELSVGVRVRLTEKARMQLRESSPCNKCNGTGKWINPRNSNDLRSCFSCKGSGRHVGAKLKNENGKQAYKELPVGLAGEVVDWGSFGQFYANGYSKPDRANTSVQFRTNDGEVVRASLSKLRLDIEPLSEKDIRKIAKSISMGYGFSNLYPRFAWDTRNYAVEAVKAGDWNGV
jgi:hypothetical protein